MNKIIQYFERLDALHEEKGFLVAEDLQLPLWLAQFWLWSAWKFNNLIRCSTVVDGTKVVCYHKEVKLLGHAHHPNAHVETRYTTDEEFFREKIWPKN